MKEDKNNKVGYITLSLPFVLVIGILGVLLYNSK
jgi:hypothetical protein